MGAPTSTSVAPVRPDFFSFIFTPSLQSEWVHVHVQNFSTDRKFWILEFLLLFFPEFSFSFYHTRYAPGTYIHSPWLPGTGLGVMAMKEVYLLSVKSSCTRSGLISDISEVLSPFNVKILDVAQVLPFFLQRRSACPGGGREMRSSEFLCGQAEVFGHTLKFAPSRGPAPLNPAPEYSHCRPFALSLAPFRPEPACAQTDSPSPLPPSLGQ